MEGIVNEVDLAVLTIVMVIDSCIVMGLDSVVGSFRSSL